MDNYEDELAKELEYFEDTIKHIKSQLAKGHEYSKENRQNLLASRKEMLEDTSNAVRSFDDAVEISQYLAELKMRTAVYIAGANAIQKLEKQRETPYFARVDFKEEGQEKTEKIYVGRYSLIEEETYGMLVYDWRSPIASVFYRFELGAVEYQAPVGTIRGNVSLKRQYEIKKGKFDYYFDASVQIVDEFLRKLLSKNASAKMTTIVETIQKDQDIIIRDDKNDLLMVQGVAGSGKTSVALHRVAYLLYQDLTVKLSANNIVVLSPSKLFAKYISSVLPELGEENVEILSFEDICRQVLGHEFRIVQAKNQFLEKLINCKDEKEKGLLKSGMEFKASSTFITMLQRLVCEYEQSLIPFIDISHNNKQLFDKELLQGQLSKCDAQSPLALRLKQVEEVIIEEVREESKIRLVELEASADQYPEHFYEAKEFARMISIEENRALLAQIRQFTEIDYVGLYTKMFQDKGLFYALAEGLNLPEGIEEIRQQSAEALDQKTAQYEDVLALTYLKIIMTGGNTHQDIKQVVIDEAQDYYQIHFVILSLLFPRAKYTVLGDVNQTIEKQTSMDFYEGIQRILAKETAALLQLNKSFRSTNQIIDFSGKFLANSVRQESFSRDGHEPEIISGVKQTALDEQLIDFSQRMLEENYQSVCILCKSMQESTELHKRIKGLLDVALIDDTFNAELSGLFITPIYMAKGLEFDAVLIYNVDDSNYNSADDKKLLYIASTRALHRLAFFYTGTPSRFLSEDIEGDGNGKG